MPISQQDYFILNSYFICPRGLGRIMAKLAHTSESVIHVGIIVLNLEKRLRAVLLWLYQESLACYRSTLSVLAVLLQSSGAWKVNLQIKIDASELA